MALGSGETKEVDSAPRNGLSRPTSICKPQAAEDAPKKIQEKKSTIYSIDFNKSIDGNYISIAVKTVFSLFKSENKNRCNILQREKPRAGIDAILIRTLTENMHEHQSSSFGYVRIVGKIEADPDPKRIASNLIRDCTRGVWCKDRELYIFAERGTLIINYNEENNFSLIFDFPLFFAEKIDNAYLEKISDNAQLLYDNFSFWATANNFKTFINSIEVASSSDVSCLVLDNENYLSGYLNH